MPRWFDFEPTHSGGDKPKLPTSTFVLPCGGENTNVSGEKTGLDFHPVRTMDEVLAVALARAVDVRPADSPAALVTH